MIWNSRHKVSLVYLRNTLQCVSQLIWLYQISSISNCQSFFSGNWPRSKSFCGQHDIHFVSLNHDYQEFLCSLIVLFIFIHQSFNTCQSHLVRSQRSDLSNLKACCFSFGDLCSNKNGKPMVLITLQGTKLEFIKEIWIFKRFLIYAQGNNN